MKIVKKNPHTNGTRHQINLTKNLLSKKNNLVKLLLKGKKKNSGRSLGKITVRHKGSGVKQKFRKIYFGNQLDFSIVLAILHDPFRNSFISLNYSFLNKNFHKTIATDFVVPGSLFSSNTNELNLGSRMTLKHIPTGSIIHSISLKNSFVKYIRSAGTFGQLIQKESTSCKVKLPSGKIFKTSLLSFATLGTITNSQSNLVKLGKAGRSRHLGIRPSVRGVAMNPVDHPHGGRTKGGCISVTPWGIPTRGKPTVKKHG